MGALFGAQSAAAAEYGMSDGRPMLFDSPHLHALEFKHVRLVLPWDAARREGTWTAWLERARLQGWQVLIAPTIDPAHDCDTGTCSGPAPADYEAALRELLARAPAVTAVAGWNEPNHGLQPTSRSPALAAAYFGAARSACEGRCTAVAGNMLDGNGMAAYLKAYQAALTHRPAVWGLHDYFDVTYFQRSGLDTLLAATEGPIWITETGGLVTFRSESGTLPYDERRAADSLRWLFTMVRQTPRVQRAYLYGMWQEPWNAFDSALLRVDGRERESMQVARAYIGRRTQALDGEEAPRVDAAAIAAAAVDPADAEAPAGIRRAGTGAANGRLYLVGKRPRTGTGGRLALQIRCVGSGPCAGKVRLGAGRWRERRDVALPAFGSRVVRFRLPATAAKRVDLRLPLARAAWVAVCDASATCGASKWVKLRAE
ncbi:MAG: hypothetical protein JHD16_17135 [Solirubrobacteraceae bacterium]|nr:hypothetical protein [Solirubrobacteraceae bacterium]